MENIVIGIEGDVASGKTTICKELINIIPNSIFIDAGSIYRGIMQALKQCNNKNLPNDPYELMKKLQVEFKIENRATTIYIAGKKISDEEIHSASNAEKVSKFARNVNNENLYKFAREIIKSFKEYNIIISGRGLQYIYPEMTKHIFIKCDLEERVSRRYNQYGQKYSKDEIRKTIIERDQLHEQSGFNKQGKNTIIVDVTNYKTASEAANHILTLI